MFQGGHGWMNSSFVKRKAGADDLKTRASQHNQQWFVHEAEG